MSVFDSDASAEAYELWARDACGEFDLPHISEAFNAGWTANLVNLFADSVATAVDAVWRPEVIAFANLMERQLRANDHKPGWKDDEPFSLQERVEQEVAELSTAVAEWESRTGYTEAALARAVGREAADVANMAMMVADVCGALVTPTPASGEPA